MTQHELNIAAALADGVDVGLDPTCTTSTVLRAWLRGAQELRALGRPVTLSTLSEYHAPIPLPPPPSPAVLDDSIASCEDSATERRVRSLLDSPKRGMAFVDEVLGALGHVGKGARNRARPMSQLVKEEVDLFRAGGTRARFVETGITDFDREIGGLPRGVVTVLGARPGVGKSTSALAIADGASRNGSGVHILSLEDPAWRYTHKLLAKRTGVPVGSIACAGLGPESVVVPENWLVDDTVGHTARSACRAVRARAKANGTQLVVVDYVQLLQREPGAEGAGDHAVLARAMGEFVALARDLDAAVVVVSQLNRNADERSKPAMADLKASGAIEETAKLVVLLAQGEDGTSMRWHIVKNNFGRVLDLDLGFDGATCRVW